MAGTTYAAELVERLGRVGQEPEQVDWVQVAQEHLDELSELMSLLEALQALEERLAGLVRKRFVRSLQEWGTWAKSVEFVGHVPALDEVHRMKVPYTTREMVLMDTSERVGEFDERWKQRLGRTALWATVAPRHERKRLNKLLARLEADVRRCDLSDLV